MTSVAALTDAVWALASLPQLDWARDGDHGLTGTAQGTDREVRQAVLEWALKFGVKPVTGEPELQVTDHGPVYLSGFVTVELPYPGGATVAGVPVGPRTVNW
jgi:hypothetical protein